MDWSEWKEALIRRRALLIAPCAFAGLVAVSSRSETDTSAGMGDVRIIEFNERGSRTGSRLVKKVIKSAAEWKAQLSPEQFYVTRRKATDTAYTGTYYQLPETGLFRCICCGTALFSSAQKFDSGTGWPSFWAPVAEENIRVAGYQHAHAAHGSALPEVRRAPGPRFRRRTGTHQFALLH